MEWIITILEAIMIVLLIVGAVAFGMAHTRHLEFMITKTRNTR